MVNKLKINEGPSNVHMKYIRSSISTEVVDDALRNYTLNPMEFISDSVFEEGLSLYGNDGPITLYRGLNFATKEAYDLFMDNISYGYLLTKSYSSWSPSKQVASNFARTRPSYMEFMDTENMKLISLQRKQSERIVGYRGVILKTRIRQDQGIDFRKTGYGKEAEILLDKGSYKVSVELITSYKDQIKDKDINEVIMTTRSLTELEKLFNYVFKHYQPEDLTDDSKHRLFLLKNKRLSVGLYSTKIQEPDKFNDNDARLSVYYISGDLNYLDWYTDEDQHILYKKNKKAFPGMLNQVFKLFNELGASQYSLDWQFNVNRIASFVNERHTLTRNLQVLKNEYDKQADNTRKINKMTNLKDKNDAIDKERDRILRVLKGMIY